jgi:hypothetical protein
MSPAVNKASRFSLTALTLPGSVVTKVLPIVPAIGLDSAAIGVCLREDEIIKWTKPGASRVIKGEIAWLEGSEHATGKMYPGGTYFWRRISNSKPRSSRSDNPVNLVIACPARPGSDYTLDRFRIVADDSRIILPDENVLSGGENLPDSWSRSVCAVITSSCIADWKIEVVNDYLGTSRGDLRTGKNGYTIQAHVKRSR